MPLAKDIAIELRKVADLLDKHPETELPRPDLDFFCHTKNDFLNAVKFVPRPADKRVDSWSMPRLRLTHKADALHVEANVSQSITCELVEPAREAVYRCPPLLSLEEESALTEVSDADHS